MGGSLSTISQSVGKNQSSLNEDYKNFENLMTTIFSQHGITRNGDQRYEEIGYDDQTNICEHYKVFEDKFIDRSFTDKWSNLNLGIVVGRLGLVRDDLPEKESDKKRLCEILFGYIKRRVKLLNVVIDSIYQLSYCVLSRQSMENLADTFNWGEPVVNYAFDFLDIIKDYIVAKDRNDLAIREAKKRGDKDFSKLPYDKKSMDNLEKIMKQLYDQQSEYVNKIKEIWGKLNSPYYVTNEELINLDASFSKIYSSLGKKCETSFVNMNKFKEYYDKEKPTLKIESDDLSITERAKKFYNEKLKKQ